jgi:hypothetical protein
MTRNNPRFPSVDERLWAQMAGYDIAPVEDTLATYQRHRAEMVWQLRRMPLEAWSRVGTHETRGELTLFAIVQDFVDHEAEHAAELEKILAHYQASDAQS